MSAFFWYLVSIQPVTRNSSSNIDFEVKTGASLTSIINELSAAKLIRSRTAFKFTVLRLGLSNKIQAGSFSLSPNMTAGELAVSLTKAYAKQVRVTIPEGLRSEEINLILEKAFDGVKGNQYSSDQFATLSKKLEGRLFPNTYDFALDSNAQDVVNRLTSQFQTTIDPLNISAERLNHVIIVASLLEREAASASEMPQIAGVIEKRLANGWPLQIDATVQYALASKTCKKIDCTWWKESLTRDDLALISPYNTYLNKGLPVGPIANPGKEALAAAAKPLASSAWFYLHDPKGGIHFADSIEQHNQNICTYLKKDCK